MTTLDDLATLLHETARKSGFWDQPTDDYFISTKLALIHSEVSETLEAVRKNMGARKIADEVVDILIRTLDLYEGMREAGMVTHSLDDAMDEKAKTNKSRPKLHGARF